MEEAGQLPVTEKIVRHTGVYRKNCKRFFMPFYMGKWLTADPNIYLWGCQRQIPYGKGDRHMEEIKQKGEWDAGRKGRQPEPGGG